MTLRTAATGHSPAKNFRAVSFRICWLSDSPNCISLLLMILANCYLPIASCCSVALWQSQYKMSNNIALNFRCSGLNRIAARAQVSIGPHAIVDGVIVAGPKLPVRPQQLLRDLLEALVQLAPENFLDRSLRPGHAGSADAAEGAHLVAAHDLDFRIALRQLLSDNRIFRRRPAVALRLLCQIDQPLHVAAVGDLQTGAKSSALVHEGAHGDAPALIDFPNHIGHRHANVMEEELDRKSTRLNSSHIPLSRMPS